MRAKILVVISILSILSGLSIAIHAEDAAIPLTKGQPISSAKKSLLAAGWLPRETFSKMNEHTYEHSWAGTGVLYKAGYREVETCAGTGSNPCKFNYVNKDGSCLQIITIGEFSAGEYEPKVEKWFSNCPPEEALKP